MLYLYIFFNFIDTGIGIEKVKTHGLDRLKLNWFTIGLRFYELSIGYMFGYVIIKFFQFLLSLLVSIPIERISLFYILFPLLLLIEIGFTKRNIWMNFTILSLLFRSLVKLGVFYYLDKLIVMIFL
jgi:hypothetical protein